MATLTAVGVQDGEEVDAVQMSVEEFLENRTVPVLPYVFFADNSSNIPARYHRLSDSEMEAFDPNDLHHVGVLEGHHHLLNVIGHRMRLDPGETITLVGCNSGVGAEEGNRGLSEERAKSVRDYLNDVWDIDESRMKIVARDLPETPSNQEVQDGIEENRRVEIVSSGSSILAPVATTDTLRVTNPPSLRFYPGTTTDRPVEAWTIIASQDGRDLKTFSGSGAPPRTVDWGDGRRSTFDSSPGRTARLPADCHRQRRGPFRLFTIVDSYRTVDGTEETDRQDRRPRVQPLQPDPLRLWGVDSGVGEQGTPR